MKPPEICNIVTVKNSNNFRGTSIAVNFLVVIFAAFFAVVAFPKTDVILNSKKLLQNFYAVARNDYFGFLGGFQTNHHLPRKPAVNRFDEICVDD